MLLDELEQVKTSLDAALRNSFDTPTAMQVLLRVVRDANIYMHTYTASSDLQAVEVVARWVTKIVGILGLDASATPPYSGLGWAAATASSTLDPATAVAPFAAVYASVKSEVEALELTDPSLTALLVSQDPASEFSALEAAGERSVETLTLPHIRATSRLRDELRALVVASGATLPPATKQTLLSLSDRIRDYDLADLGVQLDDQAGRSSLVKFVPAARLVAAREEKAALAEAKARAKEEARQVKERAEEEKWAKAKVPPQDMFRADAKYSEWDEDGVPTQLADGVEVAKGQSKKLRKEWEKQKKLHEEWKGKFGGEASAA